jgi:uncharacterized protein (TIGR00730 family)
MIDESSNDEDLSKEELKNNGRRPVAYLNETFLESPDARGLRILSEYLEPLSHFRDENIQDTIVFFGSARIGTEGPLSEYYEDARTLARLVTEWSSKIEAPAHRFVVCSGGGPGIMEAANQGAADAGGKTIGLNIGLPFEQRPNPYITPELSFEFHYFFMRKFWFAYLAKAMVVFPGGFGTMDELFEILTLAQTRKLESRIVIVLYGSKFWNEVINLEALVRYGTIAPEDLGLFQVADDPETALHILQDQLTKYFLEPEKPLPEPVPETPQIAKSRV